MHDVLIAAPHILILSASVGAGHMRAAEAIKSALEQLLPDARVAHVDVLGLTNPVFRKAYVDGYFQMVKRAPHLVGKLYDMLDNPDQKGIGKNTRVTFQRANFKQLTRLLREPWNLVISTHFLPPELVAHLRQDKRNPVAYPQVTVVTDFDVQGLWINSPCDAYFVAVPEARDYLISMGIQSDCVHVSGIPIDPVFAQPKQHADCLRKHGFRNDLPLILQMAGGFGFGDVEEIYRSLQHINTPVQICVVTGKNERLKQQLETVSLQLRHPCRIIGFTREIDELMAAADILVSKPGGLTTSEALARGCPLLVVNPIPGQEERNSDFLLQNGCAIKPFHLETIGSELDRLFANPKRLQAMKEAALCCGRPDAARKIAVECLKLLTHQIVESQKETAFI
jgi:processive 1,2-diacylglycerol beta-glucosyltransferase